MSFKPKPKGYFTKGHGANRKVHPIQESQGLSVKSKGVHPSRDSTFDEHTQRRIAQIHSRRTVTARRTDESIRAPIAKTPEEWKKYPNRRDVKGIDTPDGKRVKPKKLKVKPKKKPDAVKTYTEEEVWEIYTTAPKEPKPTPKPKKQPKKRRVKAPKKTRIKEAKRTKMTGVEKTHLSAMAQRFAIDPQEVDSSLTYAENKRHLKDLAKRRGYSETEIVGAETERREWVAQHEQYLSNLRSELEGAGYTVTKS